jgi:hypothetical protein
MLLHKQILLATCFLTGFLLSLFFDLEDEGNMFVRNISGLSIDYMELHARR